MEISSSVSPQVLRLLDVVGLPELVIQLATSAITEAGDDWKSQVRTNCNLVIALEVYRGCGVLISIVLLFPMFDTQATLRTCIFKHHLDLGHNSHAYEALTQIPDSSR